MCEGENFNLDVYCVYIFLSLFTLKFASLKKNETKLKNDFKLATWSGNVSATNRSFLLE